MTYIVARKSHGKWKVENRPTAGFVVESKKTYSTAKAASIIAKKLNKR